MDVDKIDREILSRASYMSNAKWFKLFKNISGHEIKVYKAFVKFLLDEKQYDISLSAYNEKGFDDTGAVGPFLYKEIEWIYIPETFETERWNRNQKLISTYISQPVTEIVNMMDSIGNFYYEYAPDGLKIYGYK